jgi:cysteine desulfurase/selenocysteine lyase
VLNVRDEFPFLTRRVNGRPLLYLDNAATTQKPQPVIDRLNDLYASGLANVHRSVNFLADEVTAEFERAREIVASFIGASRSEVVFTSNATQAINLVCAGLARQGPLKVLTTTLEHHANLLPWRVYGTVAMVPWDEAGRIDLAALREMLGRERPSLVAVSSASNFLGTIQPVADIVTLCRQAGCAVLLDVSQSVAHARCDVEALGCDYLVFSSHKVYGPSGVGVLYIRDATQRGLSPWVYGGSMVKEVRTDGFVLNDYPYRYEAGTPHIEGVIGLAAALEYVEGLGFDAIAAHEAALTKQARRLLHSLPGIRLLGPAAGEASAPLAAFEVRGIQAPAVARMLGERANIVVRSGFHCAQPAHDALRAGPTVRVSFGVYNTSDEIDALGTALTNVTEVIAL